MLSYTPQSPEKTILILLMLSQGNTMQDADIRLMPDETKMLDGLVQWETGGRLSLTPKAKTIIEKIKETFYSENERNNPY